MEIILQEDTSFGKLGDKVNVKAGFARNYLIPTGKAMPATRDNLKLFEARRAELEKAASDRLADAKKRSEQLYGKHIKIAVRVGDEGKMFGSIGTRDIAEAITAAAIPVEKREVLLPHGQLREVGEFDIDLQLHGEVTAKIKLEVIPEE